MQKNRIEEKVFWEYLESDQRELLKESLLLLDKDGGWSDNFHDWAFVVFPASKAYEGFLKKLFLDLGFITNDEYFGTRFRVGKALNPELEERYEKESIYLKLKDFCGSEELPQLLWDTWREARNRTFHWFPNHKNEISLEEARERIDMIIRAIEEAFRVCRINQKSKV